MSHPCSTVGACIGRQAGDPRARLGAPNGGDLLSEAATTAPSFLVWALRDPLEAPLQRMRVIKAWMQDGKSRERVYDVASSDGVTVDPVRHRCPDNGARVDETTCATGADVGDDEMRTLWTDPDFDGARRAFYYVRVLQNPTCRWSTWDALRTGVAPRRDLPATLQERAWSSPIWYTPA